MKRLVAVIMFCGVLLGIACGGLAKPLPFSGAGLWVQETSMKNPHIYSEVFSWYITSASNMEEGFVDKLKRPLIMSFTGKKPEALKALIDKYRGKIVAVIWDYELGSSQATAESDLLTARNYANAKGLPFGVVVLANPEASLKKNGVSYKRAKDFADFLMPMLYCQWWSCERDDKTIRAFKEEQSQTDLPLVVLIALKTLHTSKQNIIAPNQITKNFGSLNPYAFAFYQVEDLNEGYIGAINKLQSKRP